MSGPCLFPTLTVISFYVVFVCMLAGSGAQPGVHDPHHAVLLIPGVTGTILQAVEKSTRTVEDVWIRTSLNADWVLREYLLSRYNFNTSQSESLNQEWQVVVPVQDNGLFAIDTLVPNLPGASEKTQYFHDIIQLLKRWGYISGVSLFGFPYDWRQSNRHPKVLQHLRNVIAQAARFKSRRISVIAHSMGGLLFKAYLEAFPEHAKAHVESWTVIGCPFHGSPKILHGMFAGYNFGNIFVSGWTVHQLALSSPSTYELIPSEVFDWARYYGHTPSMHYLLNDQWRSLSFPDWISELEEANRWNHESFHGEIHHLPFLTELYNSTQQYLKAASNVIPKGIRATIIYGTGQDTPYDVTYETSVQHPSELRDQNPIFNFVDGDGTVPAEVAKAYHLNVSERIEVPDDHFSILTSDKVLKHIQEVVRMECVWAGKWSVGHVGIIEIEQVQGRYFAGVIPKNGDESSSGGAEMEQRSNVVLNGTINRSTWTGEYYTSRGVAQFELDINLQCDRLAGHWSYRFVTTEGVQPLQASRIDGDECVPGDSRSCTLPHGSGSYLCVHGWWSEQCSALTCDAGYSLAQDGSGYDRCKPCPKGTFKESRGAHSCKICRSAPSKAGFTYLRIGENTSNCVFGCAPGYEPSPSSVILRPILPDSSVSASQFTQCTTCPVGYYKPSTGSARCQPCENAPWGGEYTRIGVTVPTCPYQCASGYYALQDNTCMLGFQPGLLIGVVCTVLLAILYRFLLRDDSYLGMSVRSFFVRFFRTCCNCCVGNRMHTYMHVEATGTGGSSDVEEEEDDDENVLSGDIKLVKHI